MCMYVYNVGTPLSVILHLSVIITLSLQAFAMAWFIEERNKQCGKLLFIIATGFNLFKFVNIYFYLTDGVTHDEYSIGSFVPPEGTPLCQHIGAGGHLEWTNGYFSAKSPLLSASVGTFSA